jgi:hypothetical protein
VDIEDVIDLLTIVAVGDHRTLGESDAREWHRLLGGYGKDECLDAITAHRSDMPGVWLEPGHVIVRVKAARRDAYERADPNYRDADRAEALFGDEAPKFDRFNKIDKSVPDDEDYPADWTPEQRLKATWEKLQARRDQSEYEEAINRPGSLLIKPPASDEARAAAIQTFANSQLSFDDVEDRGSLPYVNPLLVVCPFCNAVRGAPCTKSGMPGKPRENLEAIAGHPARIEAAARAAGHDEPTVQAILTAAQKRSVNRQRAKWTERDKAKPPPEPIAKPSTDSEPEPEP